MKFTALLPTRNGLVYLKYAIASVLKQNYENWELIISDNASHENIEGYIRSLNEPRIKYSRSEEFLTVTQNWNRCLDLSTGDYVIMLGDDDILLKNYFQIAKKLIDHFQSPDLIYTNAFLYSYPGVHPDFPKGLFQNFGSLNAMPKHEEPFWLDLSSRLALVQEMLRFKAVYGTNMQHALIHRILIEKIKRRNQFFHSPYPDLYAMNAMFIEANRVLIYPKEMVVIGITPKSHGYYFFNKKEKEGIEFLNIQKEINSISNIQSLLIPVTGSMLSFWLGAVEMLKTHFSLEKYQLKLEYHRYREGQIEHVLPKFLEDKQKFRSEFQQLMKYLTFKEKAFIIYPRRTSHFIRRVVSIIKKRVPKFAKKIYKQMIQLMRRPTSVATPAPPFVCIMKVNSPENKFSNALEIYEQVETIDCTRC